MPDHPEGCGVCGKPIEFVGFGWSHVDDRTVHGHVAKGPKRMSIAEFKAQRQERPDA